MASAQMRHSSKAIAAKVKLMFSPSFHPDELLKIEFSIPVASLAPGQYVALYDGEVCLGAAPIIRNFPCFHELGLPVPEIYH